MQWRVDREDSSDIKYDVGQSVSFLSYQQANLLGPVHICTPLNLSLAQLYVICLRHTFHNSFGNLGSAKKGTTHPKFPLHWSQNH